MNRHLFTNADPISNTLLDSELRDFSGCRLLAIWRSPLLRLVTEWGPNRAAPKEWIKFLSALTKKGVSKDELNYCGVLRWLQWADTKITRQAILDYIDEFGLRIHVLEERGTSVGGPVRFRPIGEFEGRYQSLVGKDRRYGSPYGFQIDQGDLFDAPRYQHRWIVRHRAANRAASSILLSAPSPGDAANWLVASAWKSPSGGAGPDGRYCKYTLDGVRNYREILFVVPEYQPGFPATHFIPRNVLAHLRLSQRETSKGSRLLHIEEIQTDWHANRRGRCKGAPLARQWGRIVVSWCVQEAVENRLNGISLSDFNIHKKRWPLHVGQHVEITYRDIRRHMQSIAREIGGSFRNLEVITDEQWKSGQLVRERHPISGEEIAFRRFSRNTPDGVSWCLHPDDGPPNSTEVPAVIFEPQQDGNWLRRRPINWFDSIQVTADSRPVSPPLSPLARITLELLDDLDAELFDAIRAAATGNTERWFVQLTRLAGYLARLSPDRQALLPHNFNHLDSIRIRARQEQLTAQQAARELGMIHEQNKGLRGHIQLHRDLPKDWSQRCSETISVPKPSKPDKTRHQLLLGTARPAVRKPAVDGSVATVSTLQFPNRLSGLRAAVVITFWVVLLALQQLTNWDRPPLLVEGPTRPFSVKAKPDYESDQVFDYFFNKAGVHDLVVRLVRPTGGRNGRIEFNSSAAQLTGWLFWPNENSLKDFKERFEPHSREICKNPVRHQKVFEEMRVESLSFTCPDRETAALLAWSALEPSITVLMYYKTPAHGQLLEEVSKLVSVAHVLKNNEDTTGVRPMEAYARPSLQESSHHAHRTIGGFDL